MHPVEIEEKAEEVFDALGRKLRLRGKTLELRAKHAGRLLPRHMRRDVRYLIEATNLSENPRLIRQVDFERVRRAHRNCLRWLSEVDPRARSRDLAWSVGASAGLAILVVAGGLITVLVLRGLI